MFGRNGLDRFKKAETLEPFSVTISSSSKSASLTSFQSLQTQNSQPKGQCTAPKPVAPELTSSGVAPPAHTTLVGGGQSNWQPPDWAIEPIPGVYYLDVLKDGEILDRIDLDKRRHIFGRQFPMCDFVLDHQSVSRQHAAVVPHKNGSIYVIDLGSAHGTFVANERLMKDSPVELEVGQSLRFAASTRSYILRKNNAAFFPTPALPSEVTLPSPPDRSDEEAVLSYNTILNRFGVRKPDSSSNLSKDFMAKSCSTDDGSQGERASKIRRKSRVSFSDQLGGNLIEVVGISDGADVETEPGPVGVKEGSLVGKYESLVQTTVIPKGKEQISPSGDNSARGKGVTNKLQEVLNKVKAAPKIGIYEDLYGDSFSGKVGYSWAYRSSEVIEGPPRGTGGKSLSTSNEKSNASAAYDEEDDLFGDSLED